MSDDHGPQRQPASVPQIEAQMKQVNGELRLDYFRSLLRENTSLRAENERLLRGEFTKEEWQKFIFNEAWAHRVHAIAAMNVQSELQEANDRLRALLQQAIAFVQRFLDADFEDDVPRYEYLFAEATTWLEEMANRGVNEQE